MAAIESAPTAGETDPSPTPPLIGDPVIPVPDALARDLAPAAWTVQEWRDYWYVNPTAHEVRVGVEVVPQSPPRSGNYLIRFENQLGLATIRAYDTFGQKIDRHHVEVIASKFGSADESVEFLRHTLTALHSHIASTPFVLGAATERIVRESPTPPAALFAFHFFRQHGPELVRAIQAVLGRPHQRLDADPVLVRPHEVRQVDREAIVTMLRAGHSSPVPIGSGAGLSPLQRLRPERVWQRIPAETYDTPENRFVLHASRQMLRSVHGLMAQGWYARDVPEATGKGIGEAGEYLAMLTRDDRFVPLGPMVVTPAQSRVLQRKDGYRELTRLWHQFQRSREPLFEQLQSAIDLRSVDQLYELWVLFELIAQIGEITGETPILTPKVDAFGVPRRAYAARFGSQGTLVYNQTRHSYTQNRLRPDYLWWPTGERFGVVLDAKFRLVHLPPSASGGGDADEDDEPKQWSDTTTSGALMTMHAYRDALPDIRAAVSLYPGTTNELWDVTGKRMVMDLEALLHGDFEGVGEIAMLPQGSHANSG